MRWQAANGYVPDGQIPLGVIVFLPTAVLVGALGVAPGQTAAAGDSPYQVTTSSRLVYVPLNPDLPTVSVGEPVSIILPSNAQTPGTVTAVGPPPPTLVSSSSSSDAGSGAGNRLVVDDYRADRHTERPGSHGHRRQCRRFRSP